MTGCRDCIHFRGLMPVSKNHLDRINAVVISQKRKEQLINEERVVLCQIRNKEFVFCNNKWTCGKFKAIK